MDAKVERLNLRLEKPLKQWIVKAAILSNSPSATEFARRILRRAYDARNKGDNKRGAP